MITLADFLNASPTAFHAAESVAASLDRAGWTRLDEKEDWKLKPGNGYFIVRGHRSVAAFVPGIGPSELNGLRLISSHLDSPVWKIKTEGISREPGAWRLPVEAYGSPINRTWLDRELEIAGFVIFNDHSGQVSGRTWRSGEATAIIPSLAIHLDREVNSGAELNKQKEMAALMPFSQDEIGEEAEAECNPLQERIASGIGCKTSDILATELYLVPSGEASILGSGEGAWIVSGRLDNLAMAHAMLASLPDPRDVGEKGIMSLWFDAEEIGSRTDSGAASIFPDEVIERLVLASGGGREALMRTRRSSLMLSADMAHSIHPNFKDKHDKSYTAIMGGGPVLKSHGLRHYATDVETEGELISLARHAGMDLQKLIFRSDVPCGFSLGPLASSMASIPTVDIGSPLWSMHSSRETASLADHEGMVRLMSEHWKV